MIVILTGAGISQESGIATFRDAGGLWENVRVEEVATPGAFERDPAKVYDFYNVRRRQLLTVEPNPAHRALTELERKSEVPVLLVTQNVDDLHERAGSVNLVHMHGELLKARCLNCGMIMPWPEDLDETSACSRCGPVDAPRRGRKGRLRPHIVWFEEMPLRMDDIQKALARCTLFLTIGTSGNVYPAAGFAAEAKARGARVVEINLEASVNRRFAHEGRYGPASEQVPSWVEEHLEGVGQRG